MVRKAHCNHNSIANKFCKAYTVPPNTTYKSSSNTRKIHRRIRKHKLDPSFKPFTVELTAKAVGGAKNSTAVGPDGLATPHIKHLGPLGLSYLTNLFNLSVANNDIPQVWKQANIIPILKPGKLANQGDSYRPISLLSPAAKLLEKLVLPWVDSFLLKDPTQPTWL